MWIGIDLNGTLAYREARPGREPSPVITIGDPIPIMVERVQLWLANGYDVKIFTARGPSEQTSDWLMRHVGRDLEVTNKIDADMAEVWDDKIVCVKRDVGLAARHAGVNGGSDWFVEV